MPESHQAFQVAEVQISGLVFSQQTGFTSASIHILINQWSQLRRCTKRPAIGPGFKTVCNTCLARFYSIRVKSFSNTLKSSKQRRDSDGMVVEGGGVGTFYIREIKIHVYAKQQT